MNTKVQKQTIDTLLAQVRKYTPKAETEIIQLAYDFAFDAHKDQFRKTGEPYIEHPLAAAHILADMRIDPVIITATLLHDVPEDTMRTLIDVRKEFGSDVGTLVEGITKLGKLKYRGMER